MRELEEQRDESFKWLIKSLSEAVRKETKLDRISYVGAVLTKFFAKQMLINTRVFGVVRGKQ